MVEKLSKEEQHYLDTGAELSDAAPAVEADVDSDEIDIEAAAADDSDPAPAAAPKPAGDKGAKAKDGKDADPAAVIEKPPVPEGYVEKGAFEAERAKRKAIEKERAKSERESAERIARLEERTRIIIEGRNQAAQAAEQAEQPVDWDEDPRGYTLALRQEVDQLRQTTAQQRQQHEEQTKVEQAWNTVEQHYRADAQNFAAENPDFGEAYGFFSQSLARELGRHPKLRGNPQALQAAMRQRELEIADIALAAGESPAEYIFGMAQDRGWTKKAPDPAPAPAAKPNGNGGKPAARQPTGAEQIERLAAAKEAATSLSSAGGAPGGNKFTLEDHDRLNNEQLREFIKRKNAKPGGYDKWLQRQMAASD